MASASVMASLDLKPSPFSYSFFERQQHRSK
jgi:hypothetical protein